MRNSLEQYIWDSGHLEADTAETQCIAEALGYFQVVLEGKGEWEEEQTAQGKVRTAGDGVCDGLSRTRV